MHCVFQVGLGFLAGGGLFIFYIAFRKSHFRRFQLVGKVARISCYPVTSCKGIQGEMAVCTKYGLKMMGIRDREYIIAQKGQTERDHATQYHSPLLAEIKAFSDGKNLILSAPNMQQFKVEHGTHTQNMKRQIYCCGVVVEGIDCGDKVAEWLSGCLGQDRIRLFMLHLSWSKMNHPFKNVGHLLISEPTIDSINERIHLEQPLTPSHFRPNIVLTGCQPSDEFTWDAIAIGSHTKLNVKAFDSRLIEKPFDEQDLSYRYEADPFEAVENLLCVPASCTTPLVGIYCTVEVEGEILAGDPVYACRKPRLLHSLGFG